MPSSTYRAARPARRLHRWFRSLALALVAAMVGLTLVPVPAARAATPCSNSPLSFLPKPLRIVPRDTPRTGELIAVKINPSRTSISSVARNFDLTVEEQLLASRNIYLMRPTKTDQSPLDLATIAFRLQFASGVIYAEVDESVELIDTRFHGWPQGSPGEQTPDRTDFDHQYQNQTLNLDEVRDVSTGTKTKVAILDTGADLQHVALEGRATAIWNYVSDSADVSEVAPRAGEDIPSALGHGTFIAGLVHKVAPSSQLLIAKVLDKNGYGSTYAVAEAVYDAVEAGADVISMSFGTATRSTSQVLSDALQEACREGVLVVAAAGNSGDSTPEYPAAGAGVLSVGALDLSGTRLAEFSDRGSWVNVAAPGEGLIGPLPGNQYGVWAGTSMATALVSGQAAVLAQKRRSYLFCRSSSVWNAIVNSASPVEEVQRGSVNILGSLNMVRRYCYTSS